MLNVSLQKKGVCSGDSTIDKNCQSYLIFQFHKFATQWYWLCPVSIWNNPWFDFWKVTWIGKREFLPYDYFVKCMHKLNLWMDLKFWENKVSYAKKCMNSQQKLCVFVTWDGDHLLFGMMHICKWCICEFHHKNMRIWVSFSE